MAIFSPSRVVQIAAKLTATNRSAILLTASPVSIAGTSIPYDIDIYSLKGIGYIRELPRTFIPTDNPSDHSSTREFKAAQFEQGPKVGVQLTLVRSDTTEEFWVCQPIPFFNNGSLIEVNISQALSELVKYQIQSGFSLKIAQANLGHGLLEGNDQIHIVGHGERSGQFLQNAEETIFTVP
jgi:hypothetical protein